MSVQYANRASVGALRHGTSYGSGSLKSCHCKKSGCTSNLCKCKSVGMLCTAKCKCSSVPTNSRFASVCGLAWLGFYVFGLIANVNYALRFCLFAYLRCRSLLSLTLRLTVLVCFTWIIKKKSHNGVKTRWKRSRD